MRHRVVGVVAASTPHSPSPADARLGTYRRKFPAPARAMPTPTRPSRGARFGVNDGENQRRATSRRSSVRRRRSRDARTRATGEKTAARKIAVVGGGFAGTSVAYHALERAREAVAVTVIDRVGIAGGASGVAAGLVHPYTARGRVVWRGVEGAAGARRLMRVAASASETAADGGWRERSDDCDGGWREDVGRATGERRGEPVSREPGIVRPARTAKQGMDFVRYRSERDAADFASACVTTEEAKYLAPGLEFTDDVIEAESRGEPPCAGGLFIPNGVVVDAPRYLAALWDACELLASRGPAGTRASLRVRSITDVTELFDEFDEVVLCCGAGIAKLFDQSVIPVQLQGGHVLELKPDDSLRVGVLGTTYVAPLGETRAMVGPTKEYDATVDDFFDRAGVIQRDADARATRAERELRELASRAYPPTSSWELLNLKYGVRANPPRTPEGALPLVGAVALGDRRVWVAAGLGARGLVYHALIGDWLSRAIMENDMSQIPIECRLDVR